jgi:DNA polymerase III subunit gamma/tau
MPIITPLSVKYRPKKLDDIIGQPVVVKAFKNAFLSKTLHHAYILSGMYGSGKTSIARIIAAMENCEKGRTLEPCGVCNNCVDIFRGKSFEVNEIDAASNRGIDNIKDIKNDIYKCPINYRVKYIIIDEAHSLTGHAAEAALKMIEEPPANVRFILCTTESQKLKDTIHSRCIQWKINSVSWNELYSHLVKIADEEGVELEEGALRIAARYSKGSVRNALQNLQTMINYTGGKKIDEEVAKDVLCAVDENDYFVLFENIIEKDTLASCQTINKILRDGKESGVVLDGLHSHLNNLLIARVCSSNLSDFSMTEEEIKKFSHQASQLNRGDTILKMIDYLSNISFSITYNLDPEKLMVEFVIKSVQLLRKDSLANNK